MKLPECDFVIEKAGDPVATIVVASDAVTVAEVPPPVAVATLVRVDGALGDTPTVTVIGG